jgi:SAM-dependent methyltransferase
VNANVRAVLGGDLLNSSVVRCRICSSTEFVKQGEVSYYVGYSWGVYDCKECGCRFTQHSDAVYEVLYSDQHSPYWFYTNIAKACKALFDKQDAAGLKAELSLRAATYKYIIDRTESDPHDARYLEIGCSQGHLTSLFILRRRNVIGADVSPTALSLARKAFGDFFVQIDDPLIRTRAPYDVIFHSGTISSVADPVGMTNWLLNLLRPGGRLLFNAPNRDACVVKDQLWFDSAGPPNVVTLFPPGFWSSRFSHLADVEEQIEFRPFNQNFRILLGRLMGSKWTRKSPIPLNHAKISAPEEVNVSWRTLKRILPIVAAWSGLNQLVPKYPSEYHFFVQMIKK